MSAFLSFAAGTARADEAKKADQPAPPKTGVSYPSRTTQINKHIAFVDLYLSTAMTNAKALAALGDADSGKMDGQLISEARRNLDGALDRALAHMKHVREYRSDLAMVSPGIDPQTGSNAPARPPASADRMARLDELETHFREARAASKRLAGATLEDLAPAVDGVSTHLVAAHQTFRDIAKWTSYTMLEDGSLGTVPVKGSSDRDVPPAGPVDRDLGAPQPSSGSPGATQPDVTTPTTAPNPAPVTPKAPPTDADKLKGKTGPGSKPEPVEPAPGGGY
jgi:hypothetical protein